MEITGKLIQILPNVEGDSQRGHWVRGGFVIETGDDYPRKVAFVAFGEERVAMAKNMGRRLRNRPPLKVFGSNPMQPKMNTNTRRKLLM